MKVWMIRAGEGSRLIDEFKQGSLVAIGWNETGDLSKATSGDEIKRRVQEAYPEATKGYQTMTAGQATRFRLELKAKEDYAVTYDSERRVYHLGKITSDYVWNPTDFEYHHQRKVQWIREIPRDSLSTSTKYTLGAIMSLFLVGESAAAEILQQDKASLPVAELEPETSLDTEIKLIRDDVKSQGRELMKDKLTKLSWEEMQQLVAGLLRAMGYKTMISPAGPDQGRDVIASRDGLGLEDPRIVVEVKHRPNTQIGSNDIRSFTGGMRTGHKGVYVSTGGFSREAKYEAERSNVPLTLVNINLLVDLIIQYYDQFDSDARSLLPLTKIYWPE